MSERLRNRERLSEQELDNKRDDAQDNGEAITPSYYANNGVEVADITDGLSFNGGNAIKYVARSCRLDGNNKGEVVSDLCKALYYVARELSLRVDKLKEDDPRWKNVDSALEFVQGRLG